mmetsp:Transcript_36738/g.59262  ORF Transcript_36738/g.59262 Transcript_36738/m.59262 type:complete len:500 (-) Transcript_36738:39-1538(-)
MPPSVSDIFLEPVKKDGESWETRWDGLRLAVFCIGIADYATATAAPLGNTLKDAERIYKEINTLPGCRAVLLGNPKSKDAIYKRMRYEFLDYLARKPPEVVLIYQAGHGMQVHNDVYLIPASAACSDAHALKQTCLSHLDVFEWLWQFVDTPAKDLRTKVHFMQILDICRDRVAQDTSVLDPDASAAPELWSICFSTSHGSVAADGDSNSHSPMAQALLDPAEGIFAPGVSLRQGIENACQHIRQTISQRPLMCGLENLPHNFCLNSLVMDNNGLLAGSTGFKRGTRPHDLDLSEPEMFQGTPLKMRIQKHNQDRKIDAPLGKSFSIVLKGVIKTCCNVELNSVQIQALADTLKTYDKNIVSTKSKEMREIVDIVIAGSLDNSNDKDRCSPCVGAARSNRRTRVILEAIVAGSRAQHAMSMSSKKAETSRQVDSKVSNTNGGDDGGELKMFSRVGESKDEGPDANGVTQEEKRDVILSMIIPLFLEHISDCRMAEEEEI